MAEIFERSKVSQLIDEHFDTHPNRQGPSVGKTIQIWLMYILSEMDHRLSGVEPWVEQNLETLRWVCQEPELEASQFSDDYLGAVLEQMGREQTWLLYEAGQNRQLIRVFDLNQEVVRADSTEVVSYRPTEGLFQMGHNKTRLPGLPQLKIMLASLDPLAMPIANCRAAGQRADDQLYIPVIKRARASLAPQGLLYVGDTKLGNAANFAYLDKTQNHYLCPLSQRQFGTELLQEAIRSAQQDEENIRPVYQNKELIAQVYELPKTSCQEASQQHQWEQRNILVKSIQLAERREASLKKRLHKAQREILERFLPKQGRKIFTQLEQAEAFIKKVLRRRKVSKFLDVQYELAYDPKRRREVVKCQLQEKEEVLEQAIERLGWRVYATNCPVSQLSAQQVVHVYRREYRIEQNFHQLLNKVTRLMPIFLSKQNRIENLIRLLTLALKFSTVIQYQARQALAAKNQYLTGLIPYNKGRKMRRPTTYRLLKAFSNIKLFVIRQKARSPTYQVEPLQEHQIPVLELLQLPLEIYLHPCQRT